MVNRRALFGTAAVGMTGLPWVTGVEHAAAASGPVANPNGVLPPAGAVADGRSHPLSSRFATLDQARATYPAAKSLADELDWCALQTAIDAATARGGGAVHVPNTGRAYVLNRTLTLNPNRVTLRGDGSMLDFGSLRDSECAILFKADGAPAYGHEKHVFQGFELIGPGRDPHIAGILFRTDTDTLSSRAQIRDCAIHSFFVGALFGNRAYAIGFSHVSIYDCGFAVYAPGGLFDAGETISFSQCYFFNSEYLISNPGSFDMKFFGCSLDYARQLISDNNGGIDLVGCRLETAPPTDPPIHCNHGRLNMFGGFFLINGSREAVHAAEMFALSHPEASVHLFSVAGWNWRTTTGKLTAGPGKIHWYQGAEINQAPPEVGHP